jgi:hypothetical protein
MPTILYMMGWRLFFYSGEQEEPIHIHAKKGDMDCKYWLDQELFEIRSSFEYNMSPRDVREIKKIIFQNFDYIISEWNKFHGGKYE